MATYPTYKVKTNYSFTVYNTITNQPFNIPNGSIGTIKTINSNYGSVGSQYKSLAQGIFNGTIINFPYNSSTSNNFDVSILFVDKAGGGGQAPFEKLSLTSIKDKTKVYSSADSENQKTAPDPSQLITEKVNFIKSSDYVAAIAITAMGVSAATSIISERKTSKTILNAVVAGLVFGAAALLVSKYTSREFEIINKKK